jgi:arogenate dehydrogenase (NADP+)
MARYNQESLWRSLMSYRHSLDQLIAQIEQEDWQSLEERLKQTQLERPKFLSGE